MNLKTLCDIAIKAATEAGELITHYADQELEVEQKDIGESLASQVVTAVDRMSQDIILKHLHPTCQSYGLALLTEETEDDRSRLEKDFFWCIDPLDGTLHFIQKKRGYAVSIALVAKDGIPQLGVVYEPSTKNTYYAIKGLGAYKNGKPFVVNTQGNVLTFIADISMLKHPQFEDIKNDLENKAKANGMDGVNIIPHGGAVMNALWVLEHAPACYFKLPKQQLGGGSLWDYAATACIFHELNMPATNYHGEPLDLNRKENTFMNLDGVYFESGL